VRILVTNDDGVRAPGLLALVKGLEGLGECIVVAPDRERSGAGRSLTLTHPLRIRRTQRGFYSVDGTPTDCALVAARGAIPELIETPPDLVVSGINSGPNLGDDVHYSGTVAGAAEACLTLGIPALAVSMALWNPASYTAAARAARTIVERIPSMPAPFPVLLNVNVPDLPWEEIPGIRLTRLGRRTYPDMVVQQTDPWGRPCYWIGGGKPSWEPGDDTDYAAVSQGYVSLTPVSLDMTDHAMLERIRGWELRLQAEERQT